MVCERFYFLAAGMHLKDSLKELSFIVDKLIFKYKFYVNSILAHMYYDDVIFLYRSHNIIS